MYSRIACSPLRTASGASLSEGGMTPLNVVTAGKYFHH